MAQADPEADPRLERLYADFAAGDLAPLWTVRDDLMPSEPKPRAVPHLWRWQQLLPLAERAGRLVPVGRGGERRAIALANPGLRPEPYATATLWAAIQYLGPLETAPTHRHSQSAFRFVVEGEGVWTVVDGDPVAMRRGDVLLTPGRAFHGHHNVRSAPMCWLDGLDIPLLSTLDATFFELGDDGVAERAIPARSRSERLWGRPGLRPLGVDTTRPASTLVAYRWEHTDAALAEQLAVGNESDVGPVGPGHAAVRFTDVRTGADALATIRLEMHRMVAGSDIRPERRVGSSVWQVFDGEGVVSLDGDDRAVGRGDVFVVPSWCPMAVRPTTDMDLFTFSDAPVMEKLGLDRRPAQGPR
ncbi:MAG TPA: cupin domain-containing protein [Acidimicrobiales bacterium]|nr:cupin domain-containing protein [Acidimicrobiales bacterium]